MLGKQGKYAKVRRAVTRGTHMLRNERFQGDPCFIDFELEQSFVRQGRHARIEDNLLTLWKPQVLHQHSGLGRALQVTYRYFLAPTKQVCNFWSFPFVKQTFKRFLDALRTVPPVVKMHMVFRGDR